MPRINLALSGGVRVMPNTKYKLSMKIKKKYSRITNNKKVSSEKVGKMDQDKQIISELKEYIELLVQKNQELEAKLESLINGNVNLMDTESVQPTSDSEFPEITIQRKKKRKKSKTSIVKSESAKENSTNILVPKNKIEIVNSENSAPTVQTKSVEEGIVKETSESVLVTEKEKEKIPPIVTYNINVKDTIKKLNEAIGKNNFSLKKINNNVTHILTSNINNFIKSMEVIKAEKNSYYTYTPNTLKNTTLLLKGVDSSYDAEDIKQAFEELQVSQHITKISKYETRRSIKDKRNLNIFLIQINPKSDITVITSIKYILHQSVRFEKLVKSETIQCKNCQRYGHVASNCNMAYRCIKCKDNHGPGECQKTDRTTEPYCTNCKLVGHPANYRQCPKYLELQERRSKVRQQNEEAQFAKKQMYNHYYNPSISYSKIASTHTQPKTNCQPIQPKTSKPGSSSWDQTCNGMFGLNFSDTLRQFHDFMPSFNSIQDPITKKITLFEFFAKLTNPYVQ